MRTRVLIAATLALTLCLGLMTPALAADTPSPTTAATQRPAARQGDLVPLGEPGRFTLSAEPRTGADIVGGHTVQRGTHGFVALIETYDADGTPIGACTGTLVRKRWVLTAAHCLTGTSGAAVALRTTRLADLRRRNIYAADAAAVAPSYKPNQGRNDIGLLRLARPANVTPIKLAGARDDARVGDGTAAKIVGWGVTDGAGTQTDRLRHGRVTVGGNGACRAVFGSLWRGGRMLCAGSATTDACYGDSGGPLLVRGPHRWLQHGVTSFGDVDCATGDASVYTRVSALRPWIERRTGLPHRR